jgi:hypothetical protein
MDARDAGATLKLTTMILKMIHVTTKIINNAASNMRPLRQPAERIAPNMVMKTTTYPSIQFQCTSCELNGPTIARVTAAKTAHPHLSGPLYLTGG